MAWSEALTPTPNGCFIHLHVIPNSNKTHFPGTYNKWRHTINIHVTKPAKNNQANQEIIHLLSTFFHIPQHHIILVEGKHKRDKTFYLNSYSCEKIKQTLKGHFHGL